VSWCIIFHLSYPVAFSVHPISVPAIASDLCLSLIMLSRDVDSAISSSDFFLWKSRQLSSLCKSFPSKRRILTAYVLRDLYSRHGFTLLCSQTFMMMIESNFGREEEANSMPSISCLRFGQLLPLRGRHITHHEKNRTFFACVENPLRKIS
jgi:hypothetical protein